MKKILSLHLVILGLLTLHALADRGSIPFVSHAQVFEPSQKAFIAWNGKEEVLLLSTDLSASTPTKVLEVMPLPNEPEVKKGDIAAFGRATELINKRLREELEPSRGGGSRTPARPAGEITFHERIGAHDISVARVENGPGFIAWVNGYLKKSGVDAPVIPEEIRNGVQEYVREGFRWFVFDVVELDGTPKTNDAVQYRFKTNSLFYPLKISRSDVGSTAIDLLVLTPRMLKKFSGLSMEKVALRHSPIPVTPQEIRSLNPDFDELLRGESNCVLRIWRLEGDLKGFSKDLIAE